MKYKLRKFYNPFKENTFSFYSWNDDFQNYSYDNAIDDICFFARNIYNQPVEEPITAITYFAVRFVLVVLAEI